MEYKKNKKYIGGVIVLILLVCVIIIKSQNESFFDFKTSETGEKIDRTDQIENQEGLSTNNDAINANESISTSEDKNSQSLNSEQDRILNTLNKLDDGPAKNLEKIPSDNEMRAFYEGRLEEMRKNNIPIPLEIDSYEKMKKIVEKMKKTQQANEENDEDDDTP